MVVYDPPSLSTTRRVHMSVIVGKVIEVLRATVKYLLLVITFLASVRVTLKKDEGEK
jgi:hypothetical protein